MVGGGNRKKWAGEKRRSLLSGKAQPLNGSGHKRKESGQGRTANCVGQPWQTHEQQVDFGHTWKRGTRKAQASPAYTQPI